MNALDKQYTALLQDILDNGVKKQDRTGTGTLSVFGRQIQHKMSEGFPLITTKKMYWKGIVTELLWFLRGDTNIKFLVDNDCHIWDGDAYKKFHQAFPEAEMLSKEQFINKIKTDDAFAEEWGDLGPIYGAQWRKWDGIDQIQEVIDTLKNNPDSRRMLVSAWNVNYLDEMTLPPCHYGFQVYTRELSLDERNDLLYKKIGGDHKRENCFSDEEFERETLQDCKAFNIPTRAISLMWNQRSVDTFLGLPFNIASYGLLLEIIAKAVNMVPDELIGNLADTHLYLNHVEQAKEQIGRELSLEERKEIYEKEYTDGMKVQKDEWLESKLKTRDIPTRTREPYPLPTLNINTEFWPTESGECGEGPLDAVAVFNGFTNDNFCKCLLEEDLQLSNYQAHPHIKAPLSN
jgi:thymidylate synthase